MRNALTTGMVIGLLSLAVSQLAIANTSASRVPADVPIAGYMEVVDVAGTERQMVVTVQAAQKSVPEVAVWFKSEMVAQGWQLDGELVTATRAILPFKKNGRRCGITVTDFILNASMQMDRTIKGISLQISGPAPNQADAAATATESAMEAGDSGK